MVKKKPNRFVSGTITLLNFPQREGIEKKYYLTPEETRAYFKEKKWRTIVAFQTRNPIHRAHEYLTKCALESTDGLLIHPLVGNTKSDDIPAEVRMQCYEELVKHYYNAQHVLLGVLPASMHYAGPREALHHMIMRKNYGCTHMIIGRDHAGVGDYYGTYEAQEVVREYLHELGMHAMFFEHSFYCKGCDTLVSSKVCPHPKEKHVHLSGTKVRELLRQGEELPLEFTRKEISTILSEWIKKTNI